MRPLPLLRHNSGANGTINRMTRRKITIEVEIPGNPGEESSTHGTTHDERYADLANSVWMALKASDLPGFWVTPDKVSVGAQLNSRWDGYTENNTVIWR